MGYQYTYLIGILIGLLIWVFLFLKRKDTRKEMIFFSLILGILGPLAEIAYTKDWWQPLTITNTRIGIEDFVFGFIVGGVAAIIYSFLFNKKVKVKKVKKIKEQKRNINLLMMLSLLVLIFSFGLLILKLNSFISTILALIIPTIIIYIKRGDLIKDSFLSGFSLLIIAIITYHLLNLITPGFFDAFWYFQNIGKIIIFGIPLEEIVWFFLVGAFIGPLYEYWKEGKLIKKK